MDKTPIVLLQQRDFGQKMNASFEFAIQHFGPLVKVLALIAGPSALLTGIAQGMYQSRMLTTAKPNDPIGMLNQFMVTEYVFVAIFGFVTYFLAYASVCSFMVLYEERGLSKDITPGLVWNKLTETIWTGIGAQFMSFILILIGFLFFFFPGIYLVICFQFVLMIIIREKSSATGSLSRCFKLIKGKWWSTFGLMIIMSIVVSILAMVFQLPTLVITIMNALGFGGGIANLKGVIIVASVISMVGSVITQGLLWISVAFQYYNLVERLEGSGLRAEIESLGKGDSERPYNEERF